MKRAVTILLGGVLAACAGYWLLYLASTAPHRKLLANKRPELLWLKKEFRLSDAEMARVGQLHEAYLPQCQARCQQIAELNGKIAQAVGSASQVTPEIERLLAERAKMRAECQTEMLKHFFEVSRTMPEPQGRRYLAWVQERTCLNEALMHHSELPDSGHHE